MGWLELSESNVGLLILGFELLLRGQEKEEAAWPVLNKILHEESKAWGQDKTTSCLLHPSGKTRRKTRRKRTRRRTKRKRRTRVHQRRARSCPLHAVVSQHCSEIGQWGCLSSQGCLRQEKDKKKKKEKKEKKDPYSKTAQEKARLEAQQRLMGIDTNKKPKKKKKKFLGLIRLVRGTPKVANKLRIPLASPHPNCT